jgi:hypothetical protein
MATIYGTYTDGNKLARTTYPMGGQMYHHIVRVNFATQNLDAGESDVMEVLEVQAGSTVIMCWAQIITAGATNETCDLGYGGDADQWGDAIALDGSAGVVEDALSALPIYFAAKDTIDITATTDTADVDLTTGVVDIHVIVFEP